MWVSYGARQTLFTQTTLCYDSQKASYKTTHRCMWHILILRYKCKTSALVLWSHFHWNRYEWYAKTNNFQIAQIRLRGTEMEAKKQHLGTSLSLLNPHKEHCTTGPWVNYYIPHSTRPCSNFLLFSFLWRFLGGPLVPSLWPRAGGRAIYLEARTPAMLWTSHTISQASNKQGRNKGKKMVIARLRAWVRSDICVALMDCHILFVSASLHQRLSFNAMLPLTITNQTSIM